MILEIEQEYGIWLFEDIIKEFSLQYKFKEKFGFDIELWDTKDENGEIRGMYWDTDKIIKDLLREREERFVITRVWSNFHEDDIRLIIELKETKSHRQGTEDKDREI